MNGVANQIFGFLEGEQKRGRAQLPKMGEPTKDETKVSR